MGILFNKTKPKLIYSFLYRLARINKNKNINFVIIGSAVNLFTNKNNNPGDLDIVFENEKDMYELISSENFTEINKGKTMIFNLSKNNDLANLKKYTIKYFGFHIDIYTKLVYEISTKFIIEHSKPIYLNSDEKILVPINELYFILKAIKFEEIKENYFGRKKNRTKTKDLILLVEIYKNINHKKMIEILNKLSYNVRVRTYDVISLITNPERKDIIDIKNKSEKKYEKIPKKSSFLEFIRK